jgi:Toprim domain/CHC2 zinc finger
MFLDLAKAVRVEDEIARRGGLGLKRQGHELVGPCPQCGGEDRFAVNIKKQVWVCRACDRGGDVIALVQHIDGVSFKTAAQMLAAGTDGKPVARTRSKPVPVVKTTDDTDNTERALRLWDDASPIEGTPIAERYLARRGLELPENDEALRFYGGCPFGAGTTYPCILALFRDISTNEPKAIHRIALGTGGILIGKKMLGPVGGCAVKLDADENVDLGLVIGEGIETCLAARQLGFRPCWALGSSGALKTFPLLSGIEALTILVDNDVAYRNGRKAGQEASAECTQRWRAAGREVTLVLPKKPGADVADYFAGGRHG